MLSKVVKGLFEVFVEEVKRGDTEKQEFEYRGQTPLIVYSDARIKLSDFCNEKLSYNFNACN